MSLILDALRKSEAERRRGQAPGLHAELAPEPAPAPRWTPPRWWPVPVLAAATGLVAWHLLVPWPAARPEASVAAPGVVEATPAAVASPGAGSSKVASTAIAGDDTAPVDPVLAAPVDTRSASASGERDDAVRVPSPPPPATKKLVPAPAPAPPPTTTAREPRVELPPASIAPPAGAGGAPPTAAAVAEPAAAVPPTAPDMRPAAGDAPSAEPARLADLDAAERRQLPPLKISMHYWVQAPAERFAIIDGNRVGEGDRIGSAVIETITTDAVVIAWRGRRVRVPIR